MAEPTPDRERMALLSYLDAQREHALGILEGLDEEALRRPVLDVERFWFRAVVAGEQAVIDDLARTGDDAWQVGPDVPAAAVFDLYRREIALANAVIGATSLDAAPAWWPDERFGEWWLRDLREIVLHTMTESAGHAGHLDAVRELSDGRLWLVLTG